MVPTMPPEVMRFSTTKAWPSASASLGLTSRAATSDPPPGLAGTYTWTGLAGYSWAAAPSANAQSAAVAIFDSILAAPASARRFDRGAEFLDHRPDLGLGGDVGRGDGDGLAGEAEKHSFVQAMLENPDRAQARLAFHGLQLDRRGEPDVTHIDDAGLVFQRMHGSFQHGFERARALEQAFLADCIEGGVGGGGGERVPGIGVAVEEFDRLFGSGHECVVYPGLDDHTPHRNGAVGDDLREADHVGYDAETLGSKGFAEAPESGDDLVE